MQGKRSHRRCRSEGGTGAALAQWGALQPDLQAQGAEYAGAAHVRTASLDTSASQFMESLALHDAHASHSQRQVFETSLSADHSMSSRRGHTAHAAADTWPGAAEALVIAGSKRSHESSKSCNRGSKDNTQQDGKKESMHQHKHSFTPALPAVEEMTTEDAIGDDDRDDEDDDEDYDSERDDGCTPRARRTSGSRCRARRGGYNGRSENELLLLDPKRVKRILANRQSAARSKERRMNYTMQLEGKLQGLSQEVDKLNAQLEGLQGRGKVLLQARADLEKQVETLQQQLRQTTTENQTLVQELFGLQRSVGLPQQVPQIDTSSTGYVPGQQQQQAAAAPPVQYDTAVQQYHRPQQQDQQQQQYSQWQQYNGSGGYEAGAPPATAAGAEALQLPKSQLQYQQQQHSRRSSNSSSGYQPSQELPAAAAAPAGPLPAAGIPPLPPHGRSPSVTAAKPAGTSLSSQPGSPRIPSPPLAAAAIQAASPVLTTAAAASPLSSDAVAAADVLLMDATAAAVDTDMANDDDLDMLSVLLNGSPVTDYTAAAQQQHNDGATSAVQSMGPTVEPPAATAGLTSCHPAMQRHLSALSSFGPTNAVLGFNGSSCLNPNVLNNNQAAAAAVVAAAAARGCNWSTQSSPGAGVCASELPAFDRLAAAAATDAPLSPLKSGYTPAGTGLSPAPASRQNPSGGGCLSHPRILCSPAFSDPTGEGTFTDDISSGSLGGILGGSLTPDTLRPISSDSSSVPAAPAAAGLPAPALRPWQQQQQQQQMATAVSPHTPAHAAAAATGFTAALAPPSLQPLPHVGSVSHYTHHQQQLHAAATLGPSAAATAAPLQDTSYINFTMGANPAARHRRSVSYGGAAAQHHRSASTGSMTGMAWPGAWTEAAPTDGNHWAVQNYGMYSSTPAAGVGGGSGVSQGLGPGSPHPQQRYMAGSSGAGGPAATGLGHHRAARLSAPSLGQIAGFNPLTDTSFSAANAAATASSSGFDRLAHAMHDVHTSNSRQQQQQHRRSYSHAGTYATAPYAAAAGFSDQQLQLAQMHPAALGPVDAATAAALPAYDQLGTAAGGRAVELSLPTRTVTTSSTKIRR